MIKKFIANIVKEVISSEFQEQRKEIQKEVASALHDVSYRINVMKESAALKEGPLRGERRIHTADLNTATHMFDGYVFTNNMPTAGSVQWADLNITYKGVTYTITNGSTADKYIWWDFDATTNTTLQTSNTKPTLTTDDILIGVNDGGTFYPTMQAGKVVHGAALSDSSIGTNELGAGTVTSTILGSGAVTATKIGTGAVTETKLGDGAVTGTKIGTNAVTDTKLATGAVTETKIGTGAVSNTKLAASAVDDTKLADNAVTATKISSGAVTSTKLGTGAVTNTKLASGAVDDTKLADGAVIGTKIGAGAVAEDKLNMATHFLF